MFSALVPFIQSEIHDEKLQVKFQCNIRKNGAILHFWSY